MQAFIHRDADLLALAARIGTPAYVYDLALLRDKVLEIRSTFRVPNFLLLFATMANPRPEILRMLRDLDVGACVNSVLHLEAARDCGISPDRIQFTSTGLSAIDMQAILGAGVRTNLDSVRQFKTWFEQIGGRRAGLRINAASLVNAPNKTGDRIGISTDQIDDVLGIARANSGSVDGIHVYVGTNFRSPDDMFPVLEGFFQIARRIPDLKYVNIGGGIGVDYGRTGLKFDLKRFGAKIDEMYSRLVADLGRPVELFFEPGRGLVAGASVFLCCVTDIKSLRGQNFVAVDASIALFPRPFHHPESTHLVRRLNTLRPAESLSSDSIVVGRTTFSRDILARSQLPADLQIGDILVFSDAGAYCDSMASRFLGQQQPHCFFHNTNSS